MVTWSSNSFFPPGKEIPMYKDELWKEGSWRCEKPPWTVFWTNTAPTLPLPIGILAYFLGKPVLNPELWTSATEILERRKPEYLVILKKTVDPSLVYHAFYTSQ